MAFSALKLLFAMKNFNYASRVLSLKEVPPIAPNAVFYIKAFVFNTHSKDHARFRPGMACVTFFRHFLLRCAPFLKEVLFMAPNAVSVVKAFPCNTKSRYGAI
jgi:hypothetical protein